MSNRRTYPSDLSDNEWKLIEPLLPKTKPRGRKREVALKEVVNAILYILHEGCQWRALPHDFPHWSTVRTYFDKWKRKKIWMRINTVLREQVRQAEGREKIPSAGSIDSQSVKTTEKKGKYMAMMGENRLKAENVIF